MTALEFLKFKVNTCTFGQPFGINKLPFVLYVEVAKIMDEYSKHATESTERPVDEVEKSFCQCGKVKARYFRECDECWENTKRMESLVTKPYKPF